MRCGEGPKLHLGMGSLVCANPTNTRARRIWYFLALFVFACTTCATCLRASLWPAPNANLDVVPQQAGIWAVANETLALTMNHDHGQLPTPVPRVAASSGGPSLTSPPQPYKNPLWSISLRLRAAASQYPSHTTGSRALAGCLGAAPDTAGEKTHPERLAGWSATMH